MQKFSTGAHRDSQSGKSGFNLLPPHAIERLAKHFQNGASKYLARNWEQGIPLECYLDSALHHIFQLLDHQGDEDHAAAVLWNIACFIQTQKWIQDGKYEGKDGMEDWPIVDLNSTKDVL